MNTCECFWELSQTFTHPDKTRHTLVASTLCFSLSYLLHNLLMNTYEYLCVLLGVITDLHSARQDKTHSCGNYSVLFLTCGVLCCAFYYFCPPLNTFHFSLFQWKLVRISGWKRGMDSILWSRITQESFSFQF